MVVYGDIIIMVLSIKKLDIKIEKLIYLSIRQYLILLLSIMPKLTKVSKVAEVVLSESEDEVMSGGEEEKKVVDDSESESESDTDSDTSDDEQAGGAKKKVAKKAPVKKEVVKTKPKKALKSVESDDEEAKPKAKKAAKSQKETKDADEKPAKKPAKSRKVKADDDDKPKKELNPIMKEMNKFRNEVIGSHLGTKAPMKTIPPFKLAMVEARKQMKLGEKDKNTVEVVQKASTLFKANPGKYCD